jgi:hypothetical protein
MPHGDRIIMPKQLPKVNHKLHGKPCPLPVVLCPCPVRHGRQASSVGLTSVPTFAKGRPIAWAGE